jgi:hypothetical protein
MRPGKKFRGKKEWAQAQLGKIATGNIGGEDRVVDESQHIAPIFRCYY